MGLFGFGKKEKVLDLSRKYNEDKAINESKIKPSIQNMLSNQPVEINSNSTNEFVINENDSVEERRKKLTNRIVEMSAKIEELSNQIFLLQQRIEVLEMRNRAEETQKQEAPQNNSG